MKLTDKKLPLRVYLSCAFLGLSLVLIVIMWLFQTVFFDSFYKTVRTNKVERCASSVAQNIEDDDLNHMLKEIEEQSDMEVSVYSINQYNSSTILNPIYTPHNFMSSHSLLNMSTIYDCYFKALENGNKVTIKSDSTENSKYNMNFEPVLEKNESQLVTSAVICETDDLRYLVLVESDIAPVASTIDTLKVQLIIMTIFMIIVSIFIAVITAHYLSRPLHDTNKKAKQLAQQNYDIAFSGGNYKELCELNDTLTYSAHELQRVDNLRRELIANISHDLRTPLTMITGYSEVMRDIPGENSPENIQIIIDEANRLSCLVNDLMDISKLESGAVSMENSVFCITDCIKSIFSRYTKLIEQDGYNIIFEHDYDVYVNADPLRISQVLYNLINNAINYAGEDKTVILKQSVSPNSVCIEVIDHGVGIEESQIPYIWDRYYKVDKEHKMAVVGTGLGLSIVKNILKKYNSEFGVRSTVGFGSDFWFVLPRVDKK